MAIFACPKLAGMGNPKQKWTPEEELALRAGIDKHGAGKWRTIQKDPEFSIVLATRSNVDLKVTILCSFLVHLSWEIEFLLCIIPSATM